MGLFTNLLSAYSSRIGAFPKTTDALRKNAQTTAGSKAPVQYGPMRPTANIIKDLRGNYVPPSVPGAQAFGAPDSSTVKSHYQLRDEQAQKTQPVAPVAPVKSVAGTPTSSPSAAASMPKMTTAPQETPALSQLRAETSATSAGRSTDARAISDAYTGKNAPISITDTRAAQPAPAQSRTPAASQAIASTARAQAPSVLDALRSKVTSLSTPSEAESQLNDELTSLRESAQLGITGLEGQGRGIPLSLIRGEQAKLQGQAAIKEQTLLERIAAESAKRQAALTAAQNEYTNAQAEEAKQQQLAQREQDYQRSLTSPQQVGNSILQYDPATGSYKTLYSAPQAPEKPPATVQEYEYAKQNGYTGSFLDYQKQTSAGGSGMTDAQRTNTFNSIVSKYNASPLIAAADRLPVLESSIAQIEADPGNAAQQLNLSYAYIQALDTYQSAVREGELGLVNSIDSKIGQLGNSVQQMANGQLVRPEVALQIAAAAKNIVNTIKNAAQQKSQSFASQANVSGIGDEWNQYIGGFTQNYDQGGSSGPSGTGTPANETFFTNVGKLTGRTKADGSAVTSEEAQSWAQDARELSSQGYSAEEITDLLNQEMGYSPKVSSAGGSAQQVAAAIKQVESGGNYTARGGSGEMGAYQFMPATWKEWAGKYLGNSNAAMTQANQDKVATARIQDWIDEGYSPEQIALLWNSGKTTPVKGVNKYGVAFDSGAYAKKVVGALNNA